MKSLTLNGKIVRYPDVDTVGELVAQLGVQRDGIAVAVNDDVVPRARIDAFKLPDGDTVEIIVAVAGG
jgi:sulfur carrier protein